MNRAGVWIEKTKGTIMIWDMGQENIKLNGGNEAHEMGKNHKRDLCETGKYELWANSGKQRTMPRHGIVGTGGTG